LPNKNIDVSTSILHGSRLSQLHAAKISIYMRIKVSYKLRLISESDGL